MPLYIFVFMKIQLKNIVSFSFNPLLSVLIILASSIITKGQISDKNEDVILDQIVAVVGDEVILQSEVEIQYQAQAGYEIQGLAKDPALCFLFEELLFQKLLLNQAKIDSVDVSEDQINSELDRRMRFFVDQIGSEQKLEEYYGKSILEIKSEFRDQVESQLIVQKMRARSTENVKVTPSEVRKYFNEIPEDSLPLISSEIQISQIVKKPPISTEEKTRTKTKLEDIRKRIINGEDFGMLAYMYSEDPMSAKENGELGFVQRGALVPEFEAVAFNLKEGDVSEIIETQYGYHILKLIERLGEKVNVRHILLIPKVSNNDLENALSFLDSIYQQILIDSLTFEAAAEKFSDDDESKLFGGKMMNPQSGSYVFVPNQIEPMLLFSLDKMKVGQISDPMIMQTPDGKQAYRLIKLNQRTEPHKASLKQDYQRIQTAALEEAQRKSINAWIEKRQEDTYIKINEEFTNCKFSNNWNGL